MIFGTYVNPANAITASRYLCLPPFLYYVDRGLMQHATLWLVICGVLDLLDGPAARLFRCSSGFGELFDAVTDGICYAFCIVVLCIYGKLPWIPIIVLFATGAFNGWMRAAYAKRAGRQTNYRSFAMERMVAYVAYAAGLGVVEFEPEYYAWLIPFAMVIVVIHDYKRMLIDPVPPA